MKIFSLFFGLSLLTNVALWLVYREALGGADVVAVVSAGGGAATPRTAVGGVGGDAVVAALRGGDWVGLRDGLRAAGVEESLVRAVLRAAVWRGYEGRFKAVQGAPEAGRAWWRNEEDGAGGMTRAQREELRALREEQRALLEGLLGPDPEAPTAPWLAARYGYVAAERREALQRIDEDYNELMGELQRETRGFSLPSDRDKLRFLQEEKRRDLAAVLGPEELEAYEMRQSRTARHLRWRMTQMEATEEEFRTIYALQREFDLRHSEYDELGGRAREMSQEDWRLRNEAERVLRARLKESLGTERYQAFVRAQDNDYQQLRNATRRFQLPADTPDRIYALREELPRAATGIAEDAGLSAAEKRTALKNLAAGARERVRAQLGAEAADAFFANNGLAWLRQMEEGTVVTFTEDGGISHRRVE
jgi:hypothetical protein